MKSPHRAIIYISHLREFLHEFLTSPQLHCNTNQAVCATVVLL